MDAEQVRRLCAVNDSRLSALIKALDDASRTAAIESLLLEMRPVVRTVARRAWTAAMLTQDLEDVESTVNLRLFRRLQLARLYEEHAIHGLEEFVATLTYNSVYDLLRRRFPERTRLKSRLRYLFTHNRRFALWSEGGTIVCGPADWRDRVAARQHDITPETASLAMTETAEPANAMLAVFARLGAPLPFDDLVDLAAGLWGISAAERPLLREATCGGTSDRIEARQYLMQLWDEMRELRAPQRAALLLNLRDDEGDNALIHLVSAGIASMDELSDAIGIPGARLAAIWETLPIGDADIGEMLGLTRQQVINLRKSARERLARRMK
jgi:hypothetical protein